MYPERDFRTLIDQDSPSLSAVRAVAREPLKEVLKYWEQSEKPESKYQIYAQGITRAVAKCRWPAYTLSCIVDFPEFYQPLLTGLEQAWTSLDFRMYQKEGRTSLCIDMHVGQPTHMRSEDKMRLLEWIKVKMSVPIIVNGESYTVGVFTSHEATEVYQRIFWLSSILEEKTLISE